MIKAIIYLRVSTDQQKLSKKGLCRQLLACQSKVFTLQINQSLIFMDTDISGTQDIAARPALSLALEMLNPGDYFIAYDVDRIARSSRIFELISSYIASIKAHLVYAKENRTYYHIAAKRAEHRRIAIATSTQVALSTKKANNKAFGTPAYGFAVTTDNTIIAHAQEQEVIALATRLKEIGLSYRGITHYINNQGLTNRNKRAFHVSQIYSILNKNKHLINRPKVDQKTVEHIKNVHAQGLSLKAIKEHLVSAGLTMNSGRPISKAFVYSITKQLAPATIKKTSGKAHLPYGLTYDEDQRTIIACVYERELIYKIQELFSEQWTLSKIAHEINRQGYLNRSGNRFQATQISRIIKSKGHSHGQTQNNL
jgi:DNA invertase Pin-like site-specific DNA recombinase